MILAIWGRDGTGKSTLANALGRLFAKKDVTVIIDTDLTQPTLPARMNGQRFNNDVSLGKAVSGIGADDAAKYLHQHPQNKRLFYAGLIDHDEYLSYELGLDASDVARDFVEHCTRRLRIRSSSICQDSEQTPSVPAALSSADKIIIPITLDVQGVCWFSAVKPFLEAMNTSGRVLPVAAMAAQPTLDVIEKATDIRFAVALPLVREFRQDGSEAVSTPAAVRYFKQVLKLFKKITEVGDMSRTLRELAYEKQEVNTQKRDAYEAVLDQVRAAISKDHAEYAGTEYHPKNGVGGCQTVDW